MNAAATTTPPVRASGSLCADLLALLNLLVRWPTGSIAIEGRTLSGIGTSSNALRCNGTALALLPVALLELLAARPAWGITFSAAVLDGRRPIALAAAFTTFDLVPTFANGPEGWRWYVDEARVAAADEALAAFPIRPAVVIDGFAQLVAVWPLTAPIVADDRARRLLAGLAARLGGDVLEDPLTARLPLPGGICRNVGALHVPVVRFVELEPERTVALTELDTALAGDGARVKGAAR